MKRIVFLFTMAFYNITAFAYRGKVRPEWDINGGGGHHNLDDDLYSFLMIIGLIILFFIFIILRGSYSRLKENKKKKDNYSLFGKKYDKLEDGCGIVFGGGCLVSIVLGLIFGLFSLFTDKEKSNDSTPPRQSKKEKTIVQDIISEDNYMQSHIASNNEFSGKDTVFYYEYKVFQNKTGRSLTEYLVKYTSEGASSIEILKTIKPNQFFKSNVSIPFQKPPKQVDFSTTKVKYNNWKSRSRWGNKKETTKYLLFLDYSDCVP